MTGRTRKLGLAGIVIAGSLLSGVAFAGAQGPESGQSPKAAHGVSTNTVSPTGGGGCGGEFETASVNPADF